MIKKLLIILCCICLLCSLVFALRGKDEIFSSIAILEILQDSPQVSTSWVLSIDSAKNLDGVLRLPRYKFNIAPLFGGEQPIKLVEDGFFEISVPFITSLWNILLDSVKAFCYVGTMLVQGIVYCSYFFAYLFA